MGRRFGLRSCNAWLASLVFEIAYSARRGRDDSQPRAARVNPAFVSVESPEEAVIYAAGIDPRSGDLSQGVNAGGKCALGGARRTEGDSGADAKGGAQESVIDSARVFVVSGDGRT